MIALGSGAKLPCLEKAGAALVTLCLFHTIGEYLLPVKNGC